MQSFNVNIFKQQYDGQGTNVVRKKYKIKFTRQSVRDIHANIPGNKQKVKYVKKIFC